jgi:hypothetical protein
MFSPPQYTYLTGILEPFEKELLYTWINAGTPLTTFSIGPGIIGLSAG